MSSGSWSADATRAASPAAAVTSANAPRIGRSRATTSAIAVAVLAWRLGKPPSARAPGRGRSIDSRATRAMVAAVPPAASARRPVMRDPGSTMRIPTITWNAGAVASASRRATSGPPGTAPTRCRASAPTRLSARTTADVRSGEDTRARYETVRTPGPSRLTLCASRPSSSPCALCPRWSPWPAAVRQAPVAPTRPSWPRHRARLLRMSRCPPCRERDASRWAHRTPGPRS